MAEEEKEGRRELLPRADSVDRPDFILCSRMPHELGRTLVIVVIAVLLSGIFGWTMMMHKKVAMLESHLQKVEDDSRSSTDRLQRAIDALNTQVKTCVLFF